MNSVFGGGLFAVSTLKSPPMVLRDGRLREAKTHSDRIQRELTRDRTNLERREKSLLAECKRLAQKGDLHGARLVANQIAKFRTLSNRNLESSILIGTKMQTMVSDHKVNKAEVETIKGFAYANMFESFATAESREARYAWRMNAINHLESSTRETLDELYRGDNSVGDVVNTEMGRGDADIKVAHNHEMEIQEIFRQAMEGGKSRIGSSRAATNDISAPFILHFKLLNRPLIGTSIVVNPVQEHSSRSSMAFTADSVTIDAIKRRIVEDHYSAGQLHLFYQNGSAVKPFELGYIDESNSRFVPFGFFETLSDAGIQNGHTLYVRVLNENVDEMSDAEEANGNYGSLRDRINRINAHLRN